jgi:hypothetical protein
MKLLIKFPTRGRKSKFFEVLYKYIDLLDDVNNTYFLITLDKDDKEMYNQNTIDKLKEIKNLSYFFGKSENKVSAINRDLKSKKKPSQNSKITKFTENFTINFV